MTSCSLAISGLCKAYVSEYHRKIWPYMVQYLHLLDPEIPIDDVGERYPLVYKKRWKDPPFSMGKSTTNGHVQ